MLIFWSHSHIEQKDSRDMLLMIEKPHRHPAMSMIIRYPA